MMPSFPLDLSKQGLFALLNPQYGLISDDIQAVQADIRILLIHKQKFTCGQAWAALNSVIARTGFPPSENRDSAALKANNNPQKYRLLSTRSLS
jgi:hypothetical protein